MAKRAVSHFPDGIGALECVNIEHEEVVLIPRWIDCNRVTFKYGLGDEFIEVLRTLHLVGLDSTSPVERSLRAVVRAHDINGNEFELDDTELTARCMLHETDHCDGIVFLDKMSSLKRELVKRKIKKLQKAGKW